MRSRETLLRLHRFRTEEKRRQAADIDGMIQDFMRKYDDLDQQVKLEEGRNGVSDPQHFNYSLSAKAARSALRAPSPSRRCAMTRRAPNWAKTRSSSAITTSAMKSSPSPM